MPSLQMRVVGSVLRRLRGPTLSPEVLRATYQRRSPPLPAPPTRALRRLAEVSETQCAGRTVYTVTPRTRRSAWHILYTHGGAFVHPLIKPHWDIIAALVRATGASLSVPVYPLAPEHRHAEAFAWLERVYRALCARLDPAQLVLCGDSAGGNLALTQALRYRALGLPLPAHLILFAPWLDLSMQNPQARELERHDVMLRCAELVEQARWWCGASDLCDPALSPLFADLSGLPPILMFQGTHDVLWPDARALADKVRRASGRCQLQEVPGGFHVYMAATFLPESRATYRTLAAALAEPG